MRLFNKTLNLLSFTALIGGVVLSLAGCGKYGDPFPPEALSPQAVRELKVEPLLEGVKFQWQAPQADLRGKELKSMDGYLVERKEIVNESDIEDPEVEFVELARLDDKHIAVRDDLREKALEEGKPLRKVKVDDELKKFEYTDLSVSPGSNYLYRIVPLNQDGVEGRVASLVKVLFRGNSSEVRIFPADNLDSVLFDMELRG